MTIHLVYPYDPGRIAAPWSIGNELAAGLRAAGHDVAQYDWEDTRSISPLPGDILMGHPHPHEGFVFEQSMKHQRWSARIAMTPWGGLPLTEQMIDKLWDKLERVVLICGPYWAERVPVRWREKATCVDMAIDWGAYPQARKAWNPAGKRRGLYIGCTGEAKGTSLLSAIAQHLQDMHFGHIGAGHIPYVHSWGYITDIRYAADLIGEYDFLICPGKNDANPTAALEGLAMGLLPLATRRSGWSWPAILPSDPEMAAVVLGEWQDAPASILTDSWISRFAACRQRYTWSAFVGTVLGTL